jgi:histidine triad (HIT) family protein
MGAPCIFCAIAAGGAPVRMVHQTPDLLCFFPRHPELLGHTLIVTRMHYSDLRDCPTSLGESSPGHLNASAASSVAFPL